MFQSCSFKRTFKKRVSWLLNRERILFHEIFLGSSFIKFLLTGSLCVFLAHASYPSRIPCYLNWWRAVPKPPGKVSFAVTESESKEPKLERRNFYKYAFYIYFITNAVHDTLLQQGPEVSAKLNSNRLIECPHFLHVELFVFFLPFYPLSFLF